MLIDNKGKLFGKVNIIDLIVVLVIVVLVFGVLGMSFKKKQVQKSNTIKVKYTVEVTQKDKYYVDNIKTGEKVVNAKTKDEVGTIVGYTKKPARIFAQDYENNKIVSSEIDGKNDVYIDIEVDAFLEKPDLKKGEEVFKIGKYASYRSDSSAINGYIVGMSYDESEYEKLR